MKHAGKKAIFVMLAVCGALILLALIAAMYAMPQADSCGGCHTEIAQQVETDGHPGLTCIDCHMGNSGIERLRFGWSMMTRMRLGIGRSKPHTFSHVSDSVCTASGCHAALPVVTTGSIRFAHETCSDSNRCTQCHNQVAHRGDVRSAIDMFDCLVCHRREGRSLECTTCHDGNIKLRSTTSTFAVTHSPQWESTHGLGESLACGVCHTNEVCFRCHGPGVPHSVNYIKSHGTDARAQGAQCADAGCHRQRFCDTCHAGFDLPHPQQFVQAHAELVRADGDEGCLNCHEENDCTGCHTRHIHPGGAISQNGREN